MTHIPSEATKAAPAPEREGFRQAMAWLHTWAGLVLGWLLFAIFLTGTLSFFKEEISTWARPEWFGLPTPATAPAQWAPWAERAQQALLSAHPDATQWSLRLPDERHPTASMLWRGSGPGRFETLHMHPVTGEILAARDTMGGDFFYRFHFELRTAAKGRWVVEGRWIVGVATFAMLVALLTGVVTHRRIFKDFFTFRPGKGGQRAWLDAHNVSGVLALPFYLVITFSGLMIFHSLYMPAGIQAVYRTGTGVDTSRYFAHLQGETPDNSRRRRAGEAAPPLPAVPVASIVALALREWEGGRIAAIQVRRNAQGQPLVELVRHEGDRLQYRPERLLFDGTTGQRLQALDTPTPALKTYGVLVGLHMARFAEPGLRWALFALGLLGTAMIATGLLLWSVKRASQARRKQAAAPLPLGQRIVARLNVAAIGGLPLACAAFLLGNRLLPGGLEQRADAELGWFFATWGLALAWACVRVEHQGRWGDAVQRWPGGWCGIWAANALAWLAVPVVNATTTGAHLGMSISQGQWGWASVDLACIATGLTATALAWRLRPRPRVQPAMPQPPVASAASAVPAKG